MNHVNILKSLMFFFVGRYIFRLLKDDVANGSGDVIGEHGVKSLGVLNFMLISMIGECILDVGRGDRLIFSENIAIGIVSETHT